MTTLVTPTPRSDAAETVEDMRTLLEQMERELAAAHEALEACRVFVTPLERLKGWNEFKEDAARRLHAATGGAE